MDVFLLRSLKATCDFCGPIDLHGHHIHVSEAIQLGWATYQFECPDCGSLHERPADNDTLSILQESGARFETFSAPLEFLEPKPWPRLQVDDLISFGLALSRGDCLCDFFTHTDLDIPQQ